jgi:LysR family transcriptional regulator, hydrogen peroxide-inducible genes activator
MTLKELRYVVAVAGELHFGRAAEKCFVSQPALSLAVQKLEEELGVKLFERRRNDVMVTPTGALIVQQARRALEEIDAIEEFARGGRDPLDGTFRLGVINSVGPYLLPELVAVLHRRAPRMPLEIEEGLTANLEVMLKRGALDAIVIALPFESTGVETRVLFEEPFHLLVPNDHPFAKRKAVGSDDLVGEKLLLLRAGHCFRDQVLDACPGVVRDGDESRPSQGSSLETIRNMVASGLGISVFPASAVTSRYTNRLCRVIPFERPSPSRQIGLAWRTGFGRAAAIDAVADAVASVKRPTAKKGSTPVGAGARRRRS